MRDLTIEQILRLHELALERSGGSPGMRDEGLLVSAVAQPRMTFAGQDLYPGLVEKAAALAFSLVCNHPFVDANKRVGHAALETFLVINGYELSAPVDEQEHLILGVADGSVSREALTEWVRAHLIPLRPRSRPTQGRDAP
jgi:death on curing protein